MMAYLELLLSFFKLGLFGFGGGYAIVPLMQQEIAAHGWMSNGEFADIVAIAGTAPGPIVVNTASFVGYRTAGFMGSLAACLGVVLPSTLLVLLVSGIFFKFRKHPLNLMVFYGIRPAVTGLIAAAAVVIGKTAFFREGTPGGITELLSRPFNWIDLRGIALFGLSLFALLRLRANPILVIICSGVLGILLYYSLPILV